jgi:hypothetical protein
VWISPWSRRDGLQPLRRSLVLNAITSDENLLDYVVNEPTVTNVNQQPAKSGDVGGQRDVSEAFGLGPQAGVGRGV